MSQSANTIIINNKDMRQRFFFAHSPVRGDVVSLEHVLSEVFARREYPVALKKLLGEMLVAASLFASSLKMSGRLSIQMQGTGQLTWAMAECNNKGELRALAKWRDDNNTWDELTTADDAFVQLDTQACVEGSSQKGVLFINIEPDNGKRYQSVVERVSVNLSDCLAHYQSQSVQIATTIKLASSASVAGGIMVQKLPDYEQTSSAQPDETNPPQDADLWRRIEALTHTLSTDELLNLSAKDILHRLYHEEQVVLSEPSILSFGCTCSAQRCLGALKKLGLTTVQDIYQSDDVIDDKLKMSCDFCGQDHYIAKAQAYGLFKLPN